MAGLNDLAFDFPIDKKAQKTVDTEFGHQISIDEASTDLLYVGYSKPGTLSSESKWLIIKIEKSGTETTKAFANNSYAYNVAWDNRGDAGLWT